MSNMTKEKKKFKKNDETYMRKLIVIVSLLMLAGFDKAKDLH